MNLDSAFNMRANRRKLLITDKTRLSFHMAMGRKLMRDARAKCARTGHIWGVAVCSKCGEPNPNAIISDLVSSDKADPNTAYLVTDTGAAAITNLKAEAA